MCKNRANKCIGLTADLVNLLKLLSLGHYHFQTAVLLRQAMLISVMLLSSECWLRLSQKDIDTLEKVDLMYLRKVAEIGTKCPIPAIYLEYGCIPVRFLIKEKRILFLHYILNCERTELVSQVLWAQILKPVKNDWCNVVEEDLQQVGLGSLTIEDFQTFSKNKMKKLVKEAVKDSAFKYLMNNKEAKSKMKDLQYSELKMQEYLSVQNISNRHKKLAFKIRSNMLPMLNNLGQKVICVVCQEF